MNDLAEVKAALEEAKRRLSPKYLSVLQALFQVDAALSPAPPPPASQPEKEGKS